MFANWEMAGNATAKGLVVTMFYVRPKVKINGRVRVTGQSMNIYTENVQMIKLTKIKWRRKDDMQSKDTDCHIIEQIVLTLFKISQSNNRCISKS